MYPLMIHTHPISLDNPHRMSIQPEEKSGKSSNIDNPQPVGLPSLEYERGGVVEPWEVCPVLREVYQRRVGYGLCASWICLVQEPLCCGYLSGGEV